MSEFTKIYVPLSRDEFIELAKIASHELRDPRVQARLILRRALFGAPAELPTVPEKANSDTTRQGQSVAVAA